MESSCTGFQPNQMLKRNQWYLIQPGTLKMHWLKRAERQVSGRWARKLKLWNLIDSEWQALREMFKPGRTSPLALARAIGMSKGGASKLIERLITKGWAEKKTDRLDRRCRVVGLTIEGVWLVSRLATSEFLTDRKCFRRMGTRLRGELLKALKRIVVRPRPQLSLLRPPTKLLPQPPTAHGNAPATAADPVLVVLGLS
jgi:DNA-binding MarR family transcriptional regulator